MNLAELYREFSILFLRMIKKGKNHETCLYKISIENHCSKFTIEQLRIGRREKYSRNRVEASNLLRTVNFVINGGILRIYYFFFTRFPFEFTQFNNIEIELLIRIRCASFVSASRACSALAPTDDSRNKPNDALPNVIPVHFAT